MVQKLVHILLIVVMSLLVLTVSQPMHSVQAGSGRRVFAYYFGWHTPDSWNDSKLLDYPLRGNYASADSGVMAAQIQEAKVTGIDGFIMSWHPGLNDVFSSLLNQ